MKTVIIIPYRNREKHLSYFLENSIPKLNAIIPNLEVIIVEQTEGKKFNRGATITPTKKKNETKRSYELYIL